MKISEFNEQYKNRYRLVEIEPYRRHNDHVVRRFNLEEFCPEAKKFVRVLVPGSTWSLDFESPNDKALPDSKCLISNKCIEELNERNNEKYIIIAKEKHDTRYFSANTTEEIGKVSLMLLKQRMDFGCFKTYGGKPQEPKCKPEEFDDGSDEKEFFTKQWERYEYSKKEYLKINEDAASAKIAVKTKDYFLACSLLKSHSDYEYEGFEIVLLETL